MLVIPVFEAAGGDAGVTFRFVCSCVGDIRSMNQAFGLAGTIQGTLLRSLLTIAAWVFFALILISHFKIVT